MNTKREVLQTLDVTAHLIQDVGQKSGKPYKAVLLTFNKEGKDPIEALYFPSIDRLKLRLGLIQDN